MTPREILDLVEEGLKRRLRIFGFRVQVTTFGWNRFATVVFQLRINDPDSFQNGQVIETRYTIDESDILFRLNDLKYWEYVIRDMARRIIEEASDAAFRSPAYAAP